MPHEERRYVSVGRAQWFESDHPDHPKPADAVDRSTPRTIPTVTIRPRPSDRNRDSREPSDHPPNNHFGSVRIMLPGKTIHTGGDHPPNPPKRTLRHDQSRNVPRRTTDYPNRVSVSAFNSAPCRGQPAHPDHPETTPTPTALTGTAPPARMTTPGTTPPRHPPRLTARTDDFERHGRGDRIRACWNRIGGWCIGARSKRRNCWPN